jgi:hypothetical protein
MSFSLNGTAFNLSCIQNFLRESDIPKFDANRTYHNSAVESNVEEMHISSLSLGLHQRQKLRVATAAFLTHLTNTLEFMRTITSKASIGANAQWPRFQCIAFPTQSHKHHTSQW